MDPNETLRQLRAAIARAQQYAEGESNDLEIEAWQEVGEYFTALDEWLSKGGFLPVPWNGSGRPLPEPLARPVPPGYRRVDAYSIEPLGGPVPGVNGAHLPEGHVLDERVLPPRAARTLRIEPTITPGEFMVVLDKGAAGVDIKYSGSWEACKGYVQEAATRHE